MSITCPLCKVDFESKYLYDYHLVMSHNMKAGDRYPLMSAPLANLVGVIGFDAQAPEKPVEPPVSTVNVVEAFEKVYGRMVEFFGEEDFVKNKLTALSLCLWFLVELDIKAVK